MVASTVSMELKTHIIDIEPSCAETSDSATASMLSKRSSTGSTVPAPEKAVATATPGEMNSLAAKRGRQTLTASSP